MNNSYHFHLSHTNFHDTQNIQAQFDAKYLIKVKSSTMNEYLPESDWILGGKKRITQLPAQEIISVSSSTDTEKHLGPSFRHQGSRKKSQADFLARRVNPYVANKGIAI